MIAGGVVRVRSVAVERGVPALAIATSPSGEPMPQRWKPAVALIVLHVLAAWLAGAAHAACNLIPGTAKSFNAALGATNRPFAAPGERLEVTLRDCDTASPGLGANAADHVVTVVFQPATGPKHAVVLTAAETCTAVTSRLSACAAQLGPGGRATCVAGAGAGLAVVDHNGQDFLSFRFPDTRSTCSGGVHDGKRCTQASDCSGGTCDAGGADDTLAGPAAIAVSAAVAALPCGLASASCSSQSGLIACVDDLYANDGSCGTATALGTFPHFTALPPPNEYAQDCYALGAGDDPPGPCNPIADNLRFGLDSAGNLLLPVSWQSILVPNAIPVPRLLRARVLSPLPFTIPDAVFAGSYTPEGGKLPPIFEPQIDPSIGNPDVVSLFGSADAPYTVLRLGKRFGTCQGGANDAERCNVHEDCPGGTCPTTCVGAPATTCTVDADCGGNAPCGRLFDLSPLVTTGALLLPRPQITTPVALPGMCQETAASCMASCGGDGPCVNYAFEAEPPVNLSSLGDRTSALRSFTASEAVVGVDLNGDGDLLDTVATLSDRSTGVAQPLGAPVGCGVSQGRVITNVRQPPFSFPAVAVEGDVLAFLGSETDQNRCIENADEDFADAIVRIVRLGSGETVYGGPLRAVDAAPKIDGRPLALSSGRVFVRSAEAAMARRLSTRASVGPGGVQADAFSQYTAVSADGGLVAFQSAATNLLGPGVDVNGQRDIFVRDLVTGTTELASVGPGAAQADGFSYFPALSSDGLHVAFQSDATNLLGPGGDTNGVSDVFVYDRQTGVTERTSVATGGNPGNNTSARAALSADGRFVAFSSHATNLLGPGGDTNALQDVFVRDRQAGTTERVSVGPGGLQADGESFVPAISANGRFVAFASLAGNLVGLGGDTNGMPDVFVHDRCRENGAMVPGCTPSTERVSVGPGGLDADGFTGTPSISADGRYVAFDSAATNLLGPGGDTNVTFDIFVRDRAAGITERVSVGPGGLQADGNSGQAALSADGRFVGFFSQATNLLGPGADTGGLRDVFVHDRQTGRTERVNVGPAALQSNGFADRPAIAADGRSVAFVTDATNLLGPGGDTNGASDIVVRGLDAADPLGVDATLFADGALTDTVLEAIDAVTGAVTTLCPADETSVAGGSAAFLRPEAPVSPPATPACPKDSLNADADTTDSVVQVWPGSGGVENLHCAATAVTMSPTWVGALVSEAGEGADHDGDLDQDDTVAAFHRVGGPYASACTGSDWAPTQQAADTLVVAGDTGVFITPEAAQQASPAGLNGDGDAFDRVLQVYDLDAGANTATPAPCIAGPGPATSCSAGVRQAADDVVVGAAAATACGNVQLIAFRTPEAAEGATNLNAVSNALPTGDVDTIDDVLQVYDVVSGTLRNSGQAITPCALEACDPRRPYQVSGSVVKFLTLEAEQGGQDLNHDGTNEQLILQSFDFCTGRVTVIGAVSRQSGQNPLDVTDDSQTFFAPAGRCDLGVTCDPDADDCEDGAVCEDDVCLTAIGTCAKHTGIECVSDDDCRRCTLRQPASCVTDADCPAEAACEDQLVVAVSSAADVDDDGVPDEQDNCPATPNTAQADGDGDGVGDVCDVQQCGNGVQEVGEQCDDGNTLPGDCSPICTVDCAATPVPGCLVAGQAKLELNEKVAGKEKLKLQWKGVTTPVTVGDFGNPVSGTTAVRLCVYDDAEALVESLEVARAQALCAGKPCWKAKGTKGWGYADKLASADGISKIGYSSGDAGKGKADAKGANTAAKGQASLPTGLVAALAGNASPTMQLTTSDGLCIGATLAVKKDEGGLYQAQTP